MYWLQEYQFHQRHLKTKYKLQFFTRNILPNFEALACHTVLQYVTVPPTSSVLVHP